MAFVPLSGQPFCCNITEFIPACGLKQLIEIVTHRHSRLFIPINIEIRTPPEFRQILLLPLIPVLQSHFHGLTHLSHGPGQHIRTAHRIRKYRVFRHGDGLTRHHLKSIRPRDPVSRRLPRLLGRDGKPVAYRAAGQEAGSRSRCDQTGHIAFHHCLYRAQVRDAFPRDSRIVGITVIAHLPVMIRDNFSFSAVI